MRLVNLARAIYRNQYNRVDLPRLLTYIVTFTCNARCIMCDSWKKPSPDDLTLDEIERIVKQLPPMDAVRLSGGEPFVRKDLLDIAHLIQRHLQPMMLHVTSNGFLTDRLVDFCERREKDIPLHLLISVDGTEAKHNHVRGKTTAWSSVIKTLEALAPRRQELNMRLAVNQTIVDAEGAEEYVKLREYLKPLGVHNHVVIAYESSATYSVNKDIDVAPEAGEFVPFGQMGRQDIERLLSEVEKDIRHYPWLERQAKRYYIKGIRNRLAAGESHPNPKCVALNSHLRLFPNGDVPTCQFNSKAVGNLRRQSFQEVWYSLRANRQRDWVRACSGCWAECEVLPSAVYSGDLIRETLVPRRVRNKREEQRLTTEVSDPAS